MLMSRSILIGLFALVVVAVPAGPAVWGEPGPVVDHGIYGELLKKYVRDGVVDYAGFKSNEAQLDQYLKQLGRVDPESLSRSEQFAFYANAYNAWTIKLILSGYPGGPWKKKLVKINGRVLTLDDVEHGILRPRFGDPRVHFAINCAAKSCPPLRSEPFRGDILDQQLNEATISFLNNPGSHRLEGNRLYVSRIFKWFAEDFKEGAFSFYLQYATGDLKKELANKQDIISVTYLEYDWSLNGQ
jgi:hypothetical protein